MKPTSREVISATAATFRLDPDNLVGRNATRHYSRARQVSMFLCREMSGYSWPRVGKAHGRDHTTALHAHRTILEACQDGDFLSLVLQAAAVATASARARMAVERNAVQGMHKAISKPFYPVQWPQMAKPKRKRVAGNVSLPSEPRRIMIVPRTGKMSAPLSVAGE